jgi:hypothetical protein
VEYAPPLLEIFPPLSKNYYTRISGGFQSYQVVRVPVCTGTASLASNIVCAPWDGTSGGIVALMAGTLVFNAFSISCTGGGFRGGASSDQTTLSTTLDFCTNNGEYAYKGEGICGLPERASAADLTVTYSADFYAGGTRGRGAPCNAGGGANSVDAGGGGGALGGNGGRGGLGPGNGPGGRGGLGFSTGFGLNQLAILGNLIINQSFVL